MAQKPCQVRSCFTFSILITRVVPQLFIDSQYEFNMDNEENQTREFNGLIWLNLEVVSSFYKLVTL